MIVIVFRHIEKPLTRSENKGRGAGGNSVDALLPQNVSSRKPRFVNKRKMNVVKPLLGHFQIYERKNYSDKHCKGNHRDSPFFTPEISRNKKTDNKENKETELCAAAAENSYRHKGENRDKDVEMNEFSAYLVDIYKGHQIGIYHKGDNSHDV